MKAGHMGQDLRGYLERVRQAQPEDFLVVSKEVDPAYELTAIVAKLEREAKKRPILLFENVKGTRFPVVTNLHASRSRLALALNVPAQELQRAYLEAMENPIAPKIVVEAPAKEVVLAGQHINLYDLPQIVHHEGDAAPYFTAAISFAKHPLDGTWNCAFNRLMVKGPRNTSIHLTPASHLWEFHRVAEAQGQSLPVAFAIGVHPAIALGALALGSIEEDERAVMGALLGKPLELIKCETSEL
jgi:2,5-furandicarboxylate decarboxylase 1